jgi:hypothetical protein
MAARGTPTWTDREVALLLTAFGTATFGEGETLSDLLLPIGQKLIFARVRHHMAAYSGAAERDAARMALKAVVREFNRVLDGRQVTPEATLRAAGIDDARQAEYQAEDVDAAGGTRRARERRRVMEKCTPQPSLYEQCHAEFEANGKIHTCGERPGHRDEHQCGTCGANEGRRLQDHA